MLRKLSLSKIREKTKDLLGEGIIETDIQEIKMWIEDAIEKIDIIEVFIVIKLFLTGGQIKITEKDKIRVLYIAANPKEERKLAFDEEIHAINQELDRAKMRDLYEFIPELAVRASELLRLFKKHNPDIVHFSGHGSPASELILLDEAKKGHNVPVAALTNLFKMYKDTIRCVILNACHSEDQAEAIAQHINYVVGMSEKIKSSAAIAFSQGFYLSLGHGESVEDAFASAKIQMDIMATSDEEVPQLITRKNI